MTSLALHDLWSRKRRLIGMFSAILIGVAFLAGTLVLGDTMRSGFGTLFAEANAGTDAVVRSTTRLSSDAIEQQGALDASLLDEIRAVDGVAAAEISVQGLGQIADDDGELLGGNGPPTLAGNWIDDESLSPWRLAEGRAPAGPGEVVIDRRAADLGDFAVGDHTTVLMPQPVPVEIVGIATFGSSDSLSGATFVAFTTEEAERLLTGGPGRISAVVVQARDGVSEAALVANLDAVLPDGVEAISGADLTAEQRQDIEDDFLGLFETFLLVFAGIALLVAMFSINNAFSILVAQRSRESALLRAIGASRGQVLLAVTIEALVVGVLASAAGVAFGIALAAGLRALLDAAGLTLPTGSLSISAGDMALAATVGVVVTLVASALPALRSTRVPPLAAMRAVAVERVGSGRVRAVSGVALLVGGAAVTVAGALGDSLEIAALGGVGLLVAMVMLGPVVAGRASATLGWPLTKVQGLVGRLAVRNARRNPRRTAGTASALMVGVAVVTLFTVFAASLKASVDDATSRSFEGDLVIANDSFSGAGLAPELVTELRALPAVDVATGLGNGVADIEGETRDLTVIDPAGIDRVLDLDITAGSVAALQRDRIGVSEKFADDHGLALGDRVPVGFGDGGSEELTVGMLFDDDALVGGVLLPEATWLEHATQPSNVAVLLALREGVALEDGRAAVQAVADRFSAGDVQDREEYVASVGDQVDQMLGIVYVLLALAILIALMGIANTLALSIHERTRELGLLRAVGETRAQLRRMIRGESAVIAAFGTVGGLALGLALAWAVVRAVQSGGTLTAFAVPGGQLLVVLVVGAAAGVLAGLRPARRAARLPVLEAIATS